jgi:hypothetical protein
MALDRKEGWYGSFTATPPFCMALLKRRMNGDRCGRSIRE